MKLSNTNQRRVIIEELGRLRSHPTADELYINVRKRLPQISLGTVYRNLELLSTDGQVMKLETSGRQKRFDGNVMPHHHMRCTCCDRVYDIDDELLSEVESALGRLIEKKGLGGYRLELSGICPDCRS